MPNLKFWKKDPAQSVPAAVAPEPIRRFTAKPRTDLPGVNSKLDSVQIEKLDKLRRRRDAVLFDVEQAELATQPDNPWLERIGLLDEALEAVRAERSSESGSSELPGVAVIPAPITEIEVSDGPPPSVSFALLGETFHYEEDIDWAERGFQIARGDLQLVNGDPDHLIPSSLDAALSDALREHLTASLFVFASDLRDRSLANQPLPLAPTLSDLAKPDSASGGWFDWKGHSAAAARKEHRLSLLSQEEQRLLDEREREFQELARWADRLPIARRRLADIDAEILALNRT